MTTASRVDAISSESDPCQLLRVSEVAAMLGVHTRSVWRLASNGTIPRPVRLSLRLVRWRRADLERHLATLGDGQAARPPQPAATRQP